MFLEDDPCFCSMRNAMCSLTLNNDTEQMVAPEDTYHSKKMAVLFSYFN